MLKKIYSLLASVLLLSGCTADEIVSEKNPTDDSKVAVSFLVDVPSAAVISKSASGDETGVSNLQLITFDGSGTYLGTVAATLTSGNIYSASISKETRKVQFVSSYDNYQSIKTTTAATNAATTERVFLRNRHYRKAFPDCKTWS